jgi:dTMP kinase
VTKEPGGTPFGIQAREILLQDTLHSKRAELLLFLADRAEHYAQVIKPNQDRMVISDRGFLSGIGYALANGDFEFEHLVELNRFALDDRFPDLIVLFITNMETLTQRMGEKSLDGIEARGLEYLMSVQEKMRESLEKLDIPYLLVDATKSIETIHEEILTKIEV